MTGFISRLIARHQTAEQKTTEKHAATNSMGNGANNAEIQIVKPRPISLFESDRSFQVETLHENDSFNNPTVSDEPNSQYINTAQENPESLNEITSSTNNNLVDEDRKALTTSFPDEIRNNNKTSYHSQKKMTLPQSRKLTTDQTDTINTPQSQNSLHINNNTPNPPDTIQSSITAIVNRLNNHLLSNTEVNKTTLQKKGNTNTSNLFDPAYNEEPPKNISPLDPLSQQLMPEQKQNTTNEEPLGILTVAKTFPQEIKKIQSNILQTANYQPAAPNSNGSTNSPTVVNVTIDKVEIKATTPALKPNTTKGNKPSGLMHLDDYLKQRTNNINTRGNHE